MKKKILILFSIVLLALNVFAVDITTVINQAKSSGLEFKQIENTLKTSLNTLKLTKTGPSFAVLVEQNQDASDFFKEIPTATVQVTLPEYIDDLNVSFGANLSQVSLNSFLNIPGLDNQFFEVVTPMLNVSKVFDFSDMEMKNASDKINELATSLSYNKAILQAENNLIDAIINIMQLEINIDSAQKAFDKATTDYQNNIKLGQINEGSIIDFNAKMQLAKSESSLKTLKTSFTNAKDSFVTYYGFEYPTITSVPDCTLSFTPNAEGNTEVYISYLKLLSAQYKYMTAAGLNPQLTLTGSVSAPYAFKEDKYGVTGNVDLSFTSGNLKLSATASGSVINGTKQKPKLKISGSWSKSEAQDVSVENLQIDLDNAQSSYTSALSSYNTNAFTLESDIAAFESKYSVFETQKEYDKLICEAQKNLYELGAVSYQDYLDAQTAQDNDAKQEIMLKLEAMKISNRIKIIQL